MFAKIVLYVFIFVFLTACAAPALTPALTPTSVSIPTLTFTPAPTITATETPTSTPESTATPEALNTYIIQVGDSIESIAAKFNLTPESLLASNPFTERVKWYSPSGGTVMVGSSIKIPPQDLGSILKLNYQNEFSSALEIDNRIKEQDSEGRFIFYRNSETNVIDRVLDLETHEVMGYDASKEGIVSLTSPNILESRSRIIFTYDGGDIDKALALWKKHHQENGNPLLITENTPIELEYRTKSEADPLLRPRDWLRAGDVWITWTATGNIRITMFNNILAKPESEVGIYAKYAASGDLRQALRFTIPERLAQNRPKLQT